MRRLRVPILVLLGLASGYWWGSRSDVADLQDDGVDSPGVDDAASLSGASGISDTADQGFRDGADPRTGEIAERVGVAARDPSSLSGDFPSREAELVSEREAIRRRAEEISAELTNLRLAAVPVVIPVALPSEFDWIHEDRNSRLFHEELQREPIDAAWAGVTEARIAEFVYGRPEIIQKYGAPTIRCHTTRCEMTFLARGNGDDISVAYRDVRALFDGAYEEIEGAFDCRRQYWANANNQDGVVTLFWGVSRREQAP